MNEVSARIPMEAVKPTNSFGYFDGRAVQWFIGNRQLVGTGRTTIEAINDLANKLIKVFMDKLGGSFDKAFDSMKCFTTHPEDTLNLCRRVCDYEFNVNLVIESNNSPIQSVNVYSDSINDLMLSVLHGEKWLHAIRFSINTDDDEEVSLELMYTENKFEGTYNKVFMFNYKQNGNANPCGIRSESLYNLVDGVSKILIEKMLVTLEGKLEDGK